MKHKFSSMGRVAIALVLALSLVLVMGVPVSAAGAALTVTITEPADGSDIAVGAQFTVTAEVKNSGGVKATDVEATIAITGDASTGDALTKTVVAELPVGDTAEVSWELTCNAVGDVSITVTPAGKDFVTGADILEGDLHSATVAVTQVIPPAYFTVTGTATMTAGGNNELTVTAYYADGSVATSYAGPKTLVFSGPAVAPDGTAPTIEAVTMENEVTVTFTSGASAANLLTLTAYNAETTTVDVSDGTIDSSGDPTYDLDLTVDPAAAAGLVYTVNPASVTAGVETTVFTVQRQDAYANVVTSGATVVGLASTSTGEDEEFRATAGGAELSPAEVTIPDAASTVDFYYYDEVAGAWTIMASSAGPFNTVSTLTVDPAAIDHYTVSAVTSPQVTNTAFSVTINAYDEFDNNITSGGDAAEDVTLTYNKTDAGATPSSFTTEEGTATEDVTLTATTLGQSITFTGGTSGKTVTSSPFRVIAATTVWVDVTNGLDSNPGTEASPLKAIQDGINAAGVGGTVNVAPGTYITDTITITTDGLTLQSTGTAKETIIDATGVAISITASDVTVDDFAIETDGGSIGISIWGDDAIVQDNTITAAGAEAAGINSRIGATNTTISNNTVVNATIYLEGEGHTVSGNSGGTINISTTSSNNVITGNTLTGIVSRAIVFNDEDGTHLNNLIEGNTLSGNVTYGIELLKGSGTTTYTNLTITGNTITDNGTAGIHIVADVTWGVGNTINNNNISGNVAGIVNDMGTIIDAENNWWGDDSGPYHDPTNTLASGDAVSANVDYRPWLAAPYSAPVTTIELSEGWNLISLMLLPTDPDIDTVLAGADVTVNKVANFTGGPAGSWLTYSPPAPGNLTTMDDGKGYWIDVSADGSLTVAGVELALPGEAPPTYDVVVGWNLIGFTSTTAKTVDVYLGSVLATVQAMYKYNAATGLYEAVLAGNNLAAGHGYWLAVNAAGKIYP